MTLLDKALWHLEAHLDAPLTLDALSELCAVSKFHMLRSFHEATGLTPMTYLRARRLSQAARKLADGQHDILSIALEFQYQSHEAFTRAFVQYFGTSPTTVRQLRSTETLALQEKIKVNLDMIIPLDPPKIVERAAFKLVGKGVNSSVEDTSNIPQLWQQLAKEFDDKDLNPKIVTFGVCSDFDETGKFRYTAGMEPKAGQDTPDGFEAVSLPANTYAVFTYKGHISGIGAANYTMWNKSLPEAQLSVKQAPNFERYDHRFDPTTGRGEVEIWVPIET